MCDLRPFCDCKKYITTPKTPEKDFWLAGMISPHFIQPQNILRSVKDYILKCLHFVILSVFFCTRLQVPSFTNRRDVELALEDIKGQLVVGCYVLRL